MDIAGIVAIYGFHGAQGAGTFEEVAPSPDEMRRRFDNVRARGLPWRVAEIDSAVIGYFYASPYNARSTSKFTMQSSVYVDLRCQHRRSRITPLQCVIPAC